MLTKWLFVVLLLASQAALSIHAVDFDAHADGETCTLCLLGAGLDQINASTSVDDPLVVHDVFLPTANTACCTTGQTASYRSRAPPASHLLNC